MSEATVEFMPLRRDLELIAGNTSFVAPDAGRDMTDKTLKRQAGLHLCLVPPPMHGKIAALADRRGAPQPAMVLGQGTTPGRVTLRNARWRLLCRTAIRP